MCVCVCCRILRCTPYYYIIGVPKAATSDLYVRMMGHRGIAFTHKQYHFWSKRRYHVCGQCSVFILIICFFVCVLRPIDSDVIFRDGTPIYCPLRRTGSSVNTPFQPGIEPRAVAWRSVTLLLRHASSLLHHLPSFQFRCVIIFSQNS